MAAGGLGIHGYIKDVRPEWVPGACYKDVWGMTSSVEVRTVLRRYPRLGPLGRMDVRVAT